MTQKTCTAFLEFSSLYQAKAKVRENATLISGELSGQKVDSSVSYGVKFIKGAGLGAVIYIGVLPT